MEIWNSSLTALKLIMRKVITLSKVDAKVMDAQIKRGARFMLTQNSPYCKALDKCIE
jgi:hypothetical protein